MALRPLGLGGCEHQNGSILDEHVFAIYRLVYLFCAWIFFGRILCSYGYLYPGFRKEFDFHVSLSEQKFTSCHDLHVASTERILHLMKNSIRVDCSATYNAEYVPHAWNNDTIHMRNNLISTCTSEGHLLPQKKFYKSRLCICSRGPLLDGVGDDSCNAFLQEAKWFYSKSTPTFDDYFGHAWKSYLRT
ncbi:hypothetical protein NC651_027986 [Populus alba x Populus x berolinensis]|nr:hypothetical protein NC651_027986 [Populus alba x Populus x berolinensis]